MVRIEGASAISDCQIAVASLRTHPPIILSIAWFILGSEDELWTGGRRKTMMPCPCRIMELSALNLCGFLFWIGSDHACIYLGPSMSFAGGVQSAWNSWRRSVFCDQSLRGLLPSPRKWIEHEPIHDHGRSLRRSGSSLQADVLEYYDQTVPSPRGSFYIPAVLRVYWSALPLHLPVLFSIQIPLAAFMHQSVAISWFWWIYALWWHLLMSLQ